MAPATKTRDEAKVEAETAAPERRGAQHSFARPDAEQKTVVPVLRRVARHLASGIRAALEPISGARIRIDAPEPEFTQFDSWADRQEELCSLSIYQLSPMKGRMLMSLEPRMVAAMVDAFFGGTIRDSGIVKREFTQTDIRLIGRLALAIGDRISAAWSEFGDFSCTPVGHATNADGARIAGQSARMVTQRFRLTFPQNIRFEIELIYPLEGLQGLDELILQAGPDESRAADPIWRERMGGALGDVYLPVRSVLARPTLSLPELAELKPGDIIPISAPRSLPLLIGERVFARGTLGEQNGLAAFRIEHIERG